MLRNNESLVKRYCILLVLTIFFLNARPQDYTIVTIDTIKIKLSGGSWNLVKENREGGQFMFQNQKSKVLISLSAREKTKFEFYNSILSDMQLVDTFYRWDADFWKSKTKCDITEIKRDNEKKYIVWHLTYGKAENYNLYGLKSNYLIGLSVPKQKREEKELIELLEATYLN